MSAFARLTHRIFRTGLCSPRICPLRSACIAAALFAASIAAPAFAQTEVTGFDSNPGNLRMFKYVPSGLPTNAPLLVALHGCSQSAASYDVETGWQLFAGRFRFALLLPQQQAVAVVRRGHQNQQPVRGAGTRRHQQDRPHTTAPALRQQPDIDKACLDRQGRDGDVDGDLPALSALPERSRRWRRSGPTPHFVASGSPRCVRRKPATPSQTRLRLSSPSMLCPSSFSAINTGGRPARFNIRSIRRVCS